MNDKAFYLETFGCQMNVVDSERIVGLLDEIGYRQVEEPEQADLILLNTCAVRDKAVRKAYGHLGRFKPMKERNPDLILGMGGCIAQQEGKQLLEEFSYLDLVFGTHNVHRLPEMVQQVNICRGTACIVLNDWTVIHEDNTDRHGTAALYFPIPQQDGNPNNLPMRLGLEYHFLAGGNDIIINMAQDAADSAQLLTFPQFAPFCVGVRFPFQYYHAVRFWDRGGFHRSLTVGQFLVETLSGVPCAVTTAAPATTTRTSAGRCTTAR